MKILLTLLLTLAPGLAYNASALSVDFEGQSYKSDTGVAAVSKAKGSAPAAQKARPSAPKKWTVMVFMNAKNNLELAGLYNVNQMESVGSSKDVNIVAELGRMKGQAQGDTDLDGDWTGARRILVQKDNDEEKITSPVVDKLEKVDMGDYKRLVDFISWSKKNYPASRYMLIIWNHGSGWMDPRQSKGGSKGISFDDETGNYIRTMQIGQALREAGKVDVLAFDACLMQMGEVAAEVKDNTEVIIGSEETVPGLGYPYNAWVAALVKNPDMTNTTLGRTIVAAFKAFYDGSKQNAQLSAIRSVRFAEFETKAKAFADAAKAVNEPEAFKAARAGVIRYDAVGADSDPAMTISFYGDLSQYARLLSENLKGTDEKTAALKTAAADLQRFIARDLVIVTGGSNKNRAGHEMSESRGIGVYLPPAETRIAQERLEGIFEGSYGNFAFAKSTGWHDFVTFLYGIK